MNSIDITTSQQVVITYELASVRDRILAFFLDTIVLLGLYLGIFFIFGVIGGMQDSNLFYWVAFLVMSFYSLFWELLLNGQSPGKRSLGIQVIHVNGLEPSLNSYLLRWAFRTIDIWFTLGSVAVMSISAGARGQRLGDIVANTTVVRTANRQDVRMEQLEQLNSRSNYEPKYTGVHAFREEQMLLVKEVLDRYLKYRNTAHREALEMTAAKLAEQLGLEKIPDDLVEFLKRVIKDYVAVSR